MSRKGAADRRPTGGKRQPAAKTFQEELVGRKRSRPQVEEDPEVERVRKLLCNYVERSLFTQSEVAERCGWSDSRLSRLISGPTGLRFRDLFSVLTAIHVRPRDFFFRLYG